MKKLTLLIIMGFSFFGLFGQNNKFKTVDVKDFATFIQDTSKITVLDVRTAEEHADGYIPERIVILMS